MENKKGSGIFLGVIGVATLIVAIIGATFAFFGANAASNESAITAGGAVLKLGYTYEDDGLKYNLIPAEDYLALFAGMNEEEWYGDDVENGGERCIDQNGNEICGIYEFTIGNPSFTTQQLLFGNVKVAAGEEGKKFTNLYFAIYEDGKQVMGPTAFSTANEEGVIQLTGLATDLIPSSQDAGTDGQGKEGFKELDPSTYTKVCKTALTDSEVFLATEASEAKPCNVSNVRTYEMIVWIHETNTDQTEADSGKVFAAGINFTSANDKTGVTGIISAAKKYDPTPAPQG